MEQTNKNVKSKGLRQKAEDLLGNNNAAPNTLYQEADNLRLIHELRVHQIELELQNEELAHAIDRAETASNKYSELYNYAPIGYFTLSKDGSINEINYMGASMLQKESSQLINKKFNVFVSNDTKPVFNLFSESIFRSFALESCEVVFSTDGSDPIYVNLTGIVTKEHNQCMVTATNITRQKQADTEVKQKNKELEKLIIQKDKFFSIIAHDLRSPFNGFLGLTQIIAQESLFYKAADFQAMGETMWQSAKNLFKLLENLLQWSQMEQGVIPYNPQELRLTTFADENLVTEYQTAENKEIDVVFDIPNEIVVFADPKMLRSILGNLYSNATKFTRKGGKITISARKSGPHKVEITVQDTGIGMSNEIVNKLFLNEQVNRKGTDGELSTGLGLFLCKEFIEKHKGTISVESEIGKGTTFRFTIPGVS